MEPQELKDPKELIEWTSHHTKMYWDKENSQFHIIIDLGFNTLPVTLEVQKKRRKKKDTT